MTKRYEFYIHLQDTHYDITGAVTALNECSKDGWELVEVTQYYQV